MEAARAYVPRDPSQGVLQPLVRAWWPTYLETMEVAGSSVPAFVQKAVARLLTCGDPEHGFIRLRCRDCGTQRALPFSCKQRGLCPSCGARRMHDTAHHLVERVLPDVPIRQYVLSPPSDTLTRPSSPRIATQVPDIRTRWRI